MTSISFIVPFYNAEKYLTQCIKSIQKQSVKDIEIICIDDASTDQSLAAVQLLSHSDERIKVIHLEKNNGVGFARNLGLNQATGKYIRMVDADDFIPFDSTHKLVSTAERYGSDAVRGGFWHCDSNGKRIRRGGRYPSRTLINGDFTKERELWFFDQHWTYLFNAKSIKLANAKYDEDMVNGQDVAFLIQLMPYLKKISLIPETVYFYKKNQTSTMRGKKTKQYYLNLFKLYEMEYDQLCPKGYKEQVDSFMLYHLQSILPNIVFSSIPQDLKKEEAIEVFSALKIVIDKYDIGKLCFQHQYQWQTEDNIPLITKQIVLLLVNGHVSEVYETLLIWTQDKKKLKQLRTLLKQEQNKVYRLKNSASWKLTLPLRTLLDLVKTLLRP